MTLIHNDDYRVIKKTKEKTKKKYIYKRKSLVVSVFRINIILL